MHHHAKLADLLTDEEWAQTSARLGWPPIPREEFHRWSEDLLNRATWSRFTDEVLSVLSVAAGMLGDIEAFLMRHGAHARTTVSVLVLPGGHRLGRHQFDLAASWPEQPTGELSDAEWEQLREACQATEVLLDNLEMRARPRRYSSRLRHLGIILPPEADASAQETYLSAVAVLSHAAAGLDAQNWHGRLGERTVGEVLDLLRRHEANVYRFSHAMSQDVKEYLRTLVENLDTLELSPLTRLRELLVVLAKLEHRDSLADAARLDVFRNRPQMYEAWLLCAVLTGYSALGFEVELLDVEEDDETGSLAWKLRYARASRPVARMRCGDRTLECHFQCYRRGRPRGAMADLLAVDVSAGPRPKVIWVIDAKHSERGGYTLNDYEVTRDRYAQRLAPSAFCAVAEHFDRADLGAPSDGLVFGVRPGGPGLAPLMRLLAEAHGARGMTVAVVDGSSSYRGDLAAATAAFRVRPDRLGDLFVAFAKAAETRTGFHAALAKGLESLAPLDGPTLMEPLLAEMMRLRRVLGEDARFLVASDLTFEDGNPAALQDKAFNALILELPFPNGGEPSR